MSSLVRHLHDFAREVELTEDEWFEGIRFLTEAGRITDDKRQEFILLSDVLGLSMLVTMQNNAKPAGCTESTVLGPFFVAGAPEGRERRRHLERRQGSPQPGSRHGPGHRRTADPGAVIDVWQSDEDGLYDVQQPAPDGEREARARAQLRSDADGRFGFRSVAAASTTRSRTTARSGSCSRRSAGIPGARRTSIS